MLNDVDKCIHSSSTQCVAHLQHVLFLHLQPTIIRQHARNDCLRLCWEPAKPRMIYNSSDPVQIDQSTMKIIRTSANDNASSTGTSMKNDLNTNMRATKPAHSPARTHYQKVRHQACPPPLTQKCATKPVHPRPPKSAPLSMPTPAHPKVCH